MQIRNLASLFLAGLAAAHPGHDLTEEIAERREFLGNVKRADLSHCADKLAARGTHSRNVARRSAMLADARARRGIKRRDVDEVLNTDHNSTSLGYTPMTPPEILFTGNSSCLLTPEVTQGPYYVGGEFIRYDVRDGQEGVDTILDYQVIDVDTCEPVPDVYLEMWHCNSTGVYSGVVASGNGDESDQTNLDATFLRGIQKTTPDGVAQFETTFPGHYTGRATHIHIMVHSAPTVYANHTLGNTNLTSSHVGQAFFDQDLIAEVESLDVYNTNTQELTTNADDSILAEEAATDGVDPFFEFAYLGDSAAEGIFAWIAFGINTTYTSDVTPASFYYKEGGVTNSESGGPPDGEEPPSGTPPARL